MEYIQFTLADGSTRKLPKPCTLNDIAAHIGPNLYKCAVAGKRNGVLCDLAAQILNGDRIEIVTNQSPEGLDIVRHSTAHIMAMAIQQIFPKTQITIGPVLQDQFYYDILPPEGTKIGTHDFPKIEEAMARIVAQCLPIHRTIVPRAAAIEQFKSMGEFYKVEIIQDLPPTEVIKIYTIGDQWSDLCRGPHVPNTSKLGHFKLMSVSGAFWRGDKNNAQLTRIYGTAWATKKDLDQYLYQLEEAKKRDHVVLGKQLDLFTFYPEVSLGGPFFLPNGAKLFRLLETYIKSKNQRFGFEEIITPQIMNVEMWKTSGHYDYYHENMYFTDIDKQSHAIKPMNCPGHVKLFESRPHSYRDLPLRYSEVGVVHRHEIHGAVHGLTRTRRFAQDDAHIFCTPDQIFSEIVSCLKMVGEVYSELGFEHVSYALSTRPEKRIGEESMWDRAEKALEEALKEKNLPYEIHPGDGAFYGPKIDCKLKDSIGRYHQCATIQLDFYMPGRFGAKYISSQNTAQVPVMIHRAVLGSLERFMGVFIEHYAGHFPVGLSPVQAHLITVNESTVPHAMAIYDRLKTHGVRCTSDWSTDTLNAKIRNAQLKKIPYMVVIGAKEMESNTLSIRHWKGTQIPPMDLTAFLDWVKQESGVFWGLDVNQKN